MYKEKGASALVTFILVSVFTFFVLLYGIPKYQNYKQSRTVLGNNESVKLSPHEIESMYKNSIVLISGGNKNEKDDLFGTGAILSSDGLIVTNAHVINKMKHGYVKDRDGKIFAIKQIVGYEKDYDLAVIQVDAHGMTPILIGNSDEAQTGDKIYCIGNPLGVFEHTLSDGIISAVRKMENDYLLQITAPISPGSSGGVVINERGETIGITTAIFPTGQNLNIAIPINYLKQLRLNTD